MSAAAGDGWLPAPVPRSSWFSFGFRAAPCRSSRLSGPNGLPVMFPPADNSRSICHTSRASDRIPKTDRLQAIGSLS